MLNLCAFNRNGIWSHWTKPVLESDKLGFGNYRNFDSLGYI